MLKDLIIKTRTCRRFVQKEKVSVSTLRELVDLARLSASSGNLQPLRYILSNEPEKNEKIFPCITWAGYLKEWPGPEEGERPPAYIIILADRTVSKKVNCDHGIAAQSIMLGAREAGYATCTISAIFKEQLRKSISISERFDILLVLAIGKCRERVELEEVKEDGSIEYWRENVIHHVPKRALDDIILEEL